VVNTFEINKNESVQRSKYFRNENVYSCPLAYQENELDFVLQITSEVFFNQKRRSDFILGKGGFVKRV